MAITEIPTFDECERPNCPEDIILEFISYPAVVQTSEESLVSWRIVGTNKVPTITEINYSLNDALTFEEIDSETDDEDYSTGDTLESTIPAQNETGLLHIKAKAVIDGIIYFSELSTITVE